MFYKYVLLRFNIIHDMPHIPNTLYWESCQYWRNSFAFGLWLWGSSYFFIIYNSMSRTPTVCLGISLIHCKIFVVKMWRFSCDGVKSLIKMWYNDLYICSKHIIRSQQFYYRLKMPLNKQEKFRQFCHFFFVFIDLKFGYYFQSMFDELHNVRIGNTTHRGRTVIHNIWNIEAFIRYIFI